VPARAAKLSPDPEAQAQRLVRAATMAAPTGQADWVQDLATRALAVTADPGPGPAAICAAIGGNQQSHQAAGVGNYVFYRPSFRAAWQVPLLAGEGFANTQHLLSCQVHSDGRKVLVAATRKGEQLIDQVLTSREARLTRALTDLTDEREHRVLDEAIGLLNRLVEYEPDAKTMR
jgi:hypothetical protein